MSASSRIESLSRWNGKVDFAACSQWTDEKFEILFQTSEPGPAPTSDRPTWHPCIPLLAKIADDKNRP